MKKVARHKVYDTSTHIDRDDSRRDVLSVLGLLVLILNIVTGVVLPVHVLQMGRLAEAQIIAEDQGDDLIVVCTVAGMVVIDRNGNIVDTKPTGGRSELCVYCLPLSHGAAQAPVDIVFDVKPVERSIRLSFISNENSHAIPVRWAGASMPRAPPRLQA